MSAHRIEADIRWNGCRWDDRKAADLLGSLVMVGVTYLDRMGEPLEQSQFFGHVTAVSPRVGIRVRLDGARNGEIYTLPPDTHGWIRTHPGRYTLKSSGDVVVNPDFASTWSIAPPPELA